MKPDLDVEVLALLEANRPRWKAIAEAADVSYSWIYQFSIGKIPNAGVKTLRKVRAVIAEQREPSRAAG